MCLLQLLIGTCLDELEALSEQIRHRAALKLLYISLGLFLFSFSFIIFTCFVDMNVCALTGLFAEATSIEKNLAQSVTANVLLMQAGAFPLVSQALLAVTALDVPSPISENVLRTLAAVLYTQLSTVLHLDQLQASLQSDQGLLHPLILGPYADFRRAFVADLSLSVSIKKVISLTNTCGGFSYRCAGG